MKVLDNSCIINLDKGGVSNLDTRDSIEPYVLRQRVKWMHAVSKFRRVVCVVTEWEASQRRKLRGEKKLLVRGEELMKQKLLTLLERAAWVKFPVHGMRTTYNTRIHILSPKISTHYLTFLFSSSSSTSSSVSHTQVLIFSLHFFPFPYSPTFVSVVYISLSASTHYERKPLKL